MMEIRYKTRDLERLCTQGREMQKRLGGPGAKKLRARLADLMAAQVVGDLRRGRPHPLKGDRAGCLALDVVGGVRLVLEPAQTPVPTLPDGGIDWAQVSSVCVVEVGDYHE